MSNLLYVINIALHYCASLSVRAASDPTTPGRSAAMRPLGWFCSRLFKTFSYRAQMLQWTILDFFDELKGKLMGDYDPPSQSERRRARRALRRTSELTLPPRPVALTNPASLWPSNPSVAVRDAMAPRRAGEAHSSILR